MNDLSVSAVSWGVFSARGSVRPKLVALKEPSVTELDLDASQRLLALRLGLGDLEAAPGCGGYHNGCACKDCRKRASTVNPRFRRWLEGELDLMPRYRVAAAKPAQPWQRRVA